MRAVVYEGQGSVRLLDRPLPEPGEGEVQVRVAACGICATDRHIVHGRFASQPPLILGHELVGTVERVGPRVAGVRPGDRVAVNPNLPCGVCAPCRRGEVHLCERLLNLGVVRDGGLAEAVVAEPVSCAVHGIDLAGVRPGETVLVYGLGPIGRILSSLARGQGATRVVGVDPAPEVREDARGVVDAAVAGGSELDAALAETGGRADRVLEASGHPQAIEDGLSRVRPGGTFLQFGVADPELRASVSPYAIYRQELHLVGAFTNPFTMDRAVALLAGGALPVDAILAPPLSLAEVPRLLQEGSSPSPGRKLWVHM
jgi:threonine dehydrogenase-like Zn-dependent dehydrogenase